MIEEFHGEKPVPYLIMTDLCYQEGKKYVTMTKSSKTVKNARLFDERGTSTKLITEDLLEYNSEACFQLLCNLCYRFVMEINDTCNCNLMLDTRNNWVYSVDETSCFEKTRDTLFRYELLNFDCEMQNSLFKEDEINFVTRSEKAQRKIGEDVEKLGS